ncbi:hypothetical protein JTE90_019457 [Oedothorax gibbosus]|uniref:Uncharacterized protein n=1 Tax=Oedothorax gibbosus TaxID=931172 RepID=A0AAV6UVP4_9ARAC|nr:hypothetical protein JTE90_019457 [Oedothorax gibbosus]
MSVMRREKVITSFYPTEIVPWAAPSFAIRHSGVSKVKRELHDDGGCSREKVSIRTPIDRTVPPPLHGESDQPSQVPPPPSKGSQAGREGSEEEAKRTLIRQSEGRRSGFLKKELQGWSTSPREIHRNGISYLY